MRLPGIQRLVWEWNRRKAAQNKQRFLRRIMAEDPGRLVPLHARDKVTWDMLSFCGANDFPELALSMLTFRAHVGRPRRWLIYSDGTLGSAQIDRLQTLGFPVTLVNWNANFPASGDSALAAYARHHPLGKKYAALSHHPLEQPTLYADSDLLFYPQARGVLAGLACRDHHWFLPDIPGPAALDQNLPAHLTDRMYHVNSGLMFLQTGFEWSLGSDYIARTKDAWGYFTEQTAIHLNMIGNQAQPLDPRKFVVSVRDQFSLAQAYDFSELAARHYVNVVRHQLWSGGWQRHFPALPQLDRSQGP